MKILLELKNRLIEDRVWDLSAQLAYYLLLSFFPLLLLLFTLLSYLPYTSDVVLTHVESYIPKDAYYLIQKSLVQILDQENRQLLSVSLIVAIYPTSLVFLSVIHILNQAYRVTHRRPMWKQVLLGLIFLFALLGAFMVTLILPVIVRIMDKWITWPFMIKPTWIFIRWLIGSFILFLIFFALYKLAPNVKITTRQAIPGAVFSTLGWQLTSFGFSYYVATFADYSLLYGNLSAMIVLVIWFYLSAMILILGGELNAVLCKLKEKEE